MKIFLSYSWIDSKQADQIETFLSSIGLTVIRDINSLKYRDNIETFMASIRDCDYSLILISNDYLKSSNCLYEFIELYKEKEFLKKFMPILLENTSIYSTENKLELIQFWKEKVESTKKSISDFEPTKTISLIQELKHYETIYSEFDSIINSIAKYKNISLEEGYNSSFKDIIEFMGIENPKVKIEISRIENIKDEELQDIEINKLKNTYPGNISIIFAEGYINLTKRGNYKKAQLAFEKYLDVETNSSALNNLGLCLYNLDKLSEAEEIYKKSLLLSPSYKTYFNMGNLEAKKNNFNKAVIYWIKSIKANPYYAITYFNVGKIYTDMNGDFKNGIKYYKKALELDPHLREGYTNISSIYIRQSNFKQAAFYLEECLKYNPNDYVAMYNLGTVYQDIHGQQHKSKSLYRKSIRKNFNYTSPKIGLAKLLILEGGDFDEAKELLRDVLSINPNNKDVKMLLNFFEEK